MKIWTVGHMLRAMRVGLLCGLALLVPTTIERCAVAAGSAFRDCSVDCPKMIEVPSGRFLMGASPEEYDAGVTARGRMIASPVHSVTIRKFALGEYPVTRAEYAAFVKETGYGSGLACKTLFEVSSPHENGLTSRNPGFAQTDRDPVVCVDWNDAHAYAAWLSAKTHQHYRLPTEAEWEYAARAHTTGAWYWGTSASVACQFANVRDRTFLADPIAQRVVGGHFNCNDRYVFTSPVGSFRPNRFGLYDMLGNVSEWTQDCANFGYRGAPLDGTAWEDGDECYSRIVRGSFSGDAPRVVTVAYRAQLAPGTRVVGIGFRVAREMQ